LLPQDHTNTYNRRDGEDEPEYAGDDEDIDKKYPCRKDEDDSEYVDD